MFLGDGEHSPSAACGVVDGDELVLAKLGAVRLEYKLDREADDVTGVRNCPAASWLASLNLRMRYSKLKITGL
jgi:hypothetical protein